MLEEGARDDADGIECHHRKVEVEAERKTPFRGRRLGRAASRIPSTLYTHPNTKSRRIVLDIERVSASP
jgi:hypothetical protein